MELPEEDIEALRELVTKWSASTSNSMMMLRSNVGPAWLQGLRYECKD